MGVDDLRACRALKWACGRGDVLMLCELRKWGLGAEDLRADAREEDLGMVYNAIVDGYALIVRELRGWGLSVEELRTMIVNALSLVCKRGHVGVLRELHAWGLGAGDIRKDYRYALDRACKKGHTGIMRELYAWGLGVEDIRANYYQPLREAVIGNQAGALRELRAWGIDTDDMKEAERFNYGGLGAGAHSEAVHNELALLRSQPRLRPKRMRSDEMSVITSETPAITPETTFKRRKEEWGRRRRSESAS